MRLLLISSSIVHGKGYLDHDEGHIRRLLGDDRVRIAFIPFAQVDRDAAGERARERFGRMGYEVTQVRERKDLEGAGAIFTTGGNTFRLLKTLYERNLIEPIRELVRGGVPYMGASAGSNISAPTIKTTNDMPIVYPPSFEALGFLPFQINPHYLDPDPASTHMGETRETRLREYLEENETPVLGLREASTLLVEDATVTLLGEKTARLFRRGAEPEELPPGEIHI